MENAERMKWALEDIEKYVEQLETAEAAMHQLAQVLLDTPGAENEAQIATTFEETYKKVANDLRRLTDRGLSRNEKAA